MKIRNLLYLIGFLGIISYAQAPWLIDVQEEDGRILYNKVIEKAENYFSGFDINAKGSGYKQYMRWKEIWQYKVNPDGSLMNPTQNIQAWNNKQQFEIEQASFGERSVIGEWESLGPFSHDNTGSWSSGQGRVNVITVDPNSPNTIYIGAPDGGLWKSTDEGLNWDVLTEDLPSIGISGIAVSHADSNTIYISTGDEDGFDTLSAGIYKSTDGGDNWDLVLAPNQFNISGEIYMHPTDSNTLFLVTNGGFFKTTNGGDTWQRTLTDNTVEMRIRPTDPSTIYVVTDNDFYISTNGGDSFSLTPLNNLFQNAGRIVIDVTDANPDYVYAMVANSQGSGYSFRGLYRSVFRGQTWDVMNSSTDIHESSQAWFDYALTVSDTDPDKLFTGVLNVWTSDNGGANFTRLNEWNQPTGTTYTHADIHDLKYFNGTLYCGSDGGIYISEDDGASFTDRTFGLDISQFYRLSLGATTNNIAGGLQDNGGYAYNNGNGNWQNYHGADGMDNVISPTNPNLYYGFTQFGGSLIRTDVSTAPNTTQFVATRGGGNWITPLTTNAAGEIFAGYNAIFKLSETSGFWSLHSLDNMGSGNLEQIVFDSNNNQNVWSVNGDVIYKSTNGGLTHQAINPSDFGTITWLEVHPNDSNLIYVVSNSNVYKSEDGAVSWTNITGNLPTQNAVLVIKGQDESIYNSIYVGTAYGGLYYYDDDLNSWTTFNNQLPNAAVRDIEINTTEGNIVVATYGRGVWRSPVHERSLLSTTDINRNSNTFVVYPNPAQNNLLFNFNINEKIRVELYNLAGQKVLQQELNSIQKDITTINVNNLSNGVYILKAENAKHLITKKVVIKR